MKKRFLPLIFLLPAILLLQDVFAQKEFVQQILLDKPVQAGNLKLFPGMLNDSNKYYYLPNKLRLAKDERGEPKFLFLYYVTNESPSQEELQSIGRAGGYVHLVVGLHVLPEELEEARQELKKINRSGTIMGPVIYRGGTMALVTKSVISNSSSTVDPNQKRVLGIGPAPVLEGDNVPVSFILDSLDAKIMWESLQMPIPDIGFNLNMTLSGYQSPIGFDIVMDWDKIYKHKIFNSGLATPILKAEVGIASQELRENAGINVKQIGEDANLQKLQDVITNKLLEMCFVPFGAEGSPNWTELAKPLNDGKSYLDRASEQLDKETAAVERRNKETREENLKQRQYADEENKKRRAENAIRRKTAQEEADKKTKEAEAAREKANAEQDAERKALADADAKRKEAALAEVRERLEAENKLAEKEKDAEEARKLADAESDPGKKEQLEKEADKKEKIAADAKKEVDRLTGAAELEWALNNPERVKPANNNTKPEEIADALKDAKNFRDAIKPLEDIPEAEAEKKKEQDLPSIAVVASYQQKSIRHKGLYTASARTYFTTSLAEPFGDNIGKVNCRGCFKKINTFDPLYVQREIVCYLDGQLSNQFTSYVNYVTVMMRKKHAGGDITTKEVRIDRNNFMRSANSFRMLYGWMRGDDDRKNWLNYEYKTAWNFFGGTTIQTEWASSDLPVVPLSPPVKKYSVEFTGDPDKLKENNIRAVTVRIYYKLAGQEQMKQASLNTAKGVTSASLDYLLEVEGNETEFEYQVEWLKGSTNIKSGRIRTSQTTVPVDEVQQ